MTPVDIAAHIASGCIAASRLLTVVQPIWNRMPKWVAIAAPILMLMLPEAADAVGIVRTETDLTHFIVVSIALILPGAAAVGIAAKTTTTTDEEKK